MPSDQPPFPSHFRFASRGLKCAPSASGRELIERIDGMIQVEGGLARVPFGDLTLGTAFQPVISLAHGRVVGHETLLRARDPEGTPISPLDVFASAAGRGEAMFLDALCRALHLRNYQLQEPQSGWFFVNLNPHALMEGSELGTLVAGLLERHGLSPHRVVVEIIEAKTLDEAHLADTVRFFRELGCVIAIDDFGAGHSNFERIWRMAPDMVKLDRSMLTEATRTPRVRRILPGLASLLHEAGCLVVMEGIEDEEQALIAMEMDVDFAQGFYFGSPEARIDLNATEFEPLLSDLFERFRARISGQVAEARESLQQYTAALESVARMLHGGQSVETACLDFLQISGVDRCYLLDESGTQVTVLPGACAWDTAPDPRYEPLANTTHANWCRRPYFRRAITRPMHVQVSQPYLSTRDARSCVTLSVAVPHPDGMWVLCADLDWELSDTLLRTPSWRPPMITLSDMK